ncbi:hypothetical protein B0H19DRAFT_1375022 [Mycena capillaripes]|nr:hypothetical protein B0H19DRAFT_1375022 [Mycena capillaripes]
MVFPSLSVILSASADRLPVEHLDVICKSLGLPSVSVTSRSDVLNELGRRRREIVTQHTLTNPASVLFQPSDRLTKGTLLSLAKSRNYLSPVPPELRDFDHDVESLPVACWTLGGTGCAAGILARSSAVVVRTSTHDNSTRWKATVRKYLGTERLPEFVSDFLS